MIGSSVAFGFTVPEERTIAAVLPPELSAKVGHRVEIYNEASPGGKTGTTQNIDLRFNDVLAAQPDMIFWIIVPGDIRNAAYEEITAPVSAQKTGSTELQARAWNSIKERIASRSIANAVDLWKSHSTSTLTEHFYTKVKVSMLALT